MKPLYVGLIVAFGLAMMVLIPTLAFTAMAKQARRLRERFEHEGVIARTGHGWVIMVVRGYRSATRRSGARRHKGRGELLLTPFGLHVLGVSLEKGGSLDIPQADFKHWRASIDRRQIHLDTSQPPNATGEVQLRAYANDLPGFLAALRERGMTVS